ncbi:hypothetical protein HDU87_005013 [Geranomyces variabilis]|uniref:Uncharacterized protein n=1 Tax=Geranomyces variabilis TaxID=109894 RepID=A0AAD5TQH6_9FUNG|nr:hypothetical protein HDU87_005013 [Geranomyces variabilis]
MSHSRQRSTDVGAAVSDAADLIATLPLESQLGLVEMLMRKLAASSSRSVAKPAAAPLVAVGTATGTLKRVMRTPAGPVPPNPWDNVTVALDRARADFERQAAGRPLPGSLTAVLRLPDEVLPIATILNDLRAARGARLFGELDAVLGITLSRRRDPLAAIQEAVLSILMHAPIVLVSSSAFTPTVQKIPGAEDEDDSHSPLARVLTASSSLAALIEAMVLRHNDHILASLNDQRGLEDYQRISEGVWEATSGILKDVKRLKEGMPAGASWSQAQYLYAHFIQVATQFAAALVDYVAFADTALPELSYAACDPDIPPVTVTLSPPETPPVEPSAIEAAAPSSDSAAVSVSGDRTLKQKSLGARLMHRLSQLTETARRSSTYSNSSDGSMSETSQPTRFSRQSDATYDFTEVSGSNNLSVGIGRRPSSFDIPHRSVDTVNSSSLSPPSAHLNVGRSSLDALRPRLADITSVNYPNTHNRSAGGTSPAPADRPPMPPIQPRRTSQATPPTLPEISRGHYKAAEWLLEISEFESSPDRPPSVRDSSLDFGTRSSFDASERAVSPARSARGRGGIGDFQPPLPRILTQSPPPARPRTPSAGRQSRGHSRKPSNSSMSSAKVRLLQAESWKIKLPTDPGEGYGLRDTDRWSRMMDNIINGEEEGFEPAPEQESPSSQSAAPSPHLLSPEVASSRTPITEAGAAAVPTSADNVFESLRHLAPRSLQRVPMYDSTGRRIGVLDHGRFVTGGSASDDDNASVAAQLSHSDGAAKATAVASTEFITVHKNLLRLSRDGSDVLVMEKVGGKLQIVAGTVEKLVARLADEGAQDPEFVDVFLTCHPFFIPSRDLLACLVARFRVRPAPDDERQDESAVGNNAQQDEASAAAWAAVAGIRTKVVGVLARWVKLRFEDFEADPLLHAGLNAFLAEIDNEEVPAAGTAAARFLPLRNETDRVRRVATVQAMSICSRARLAPFGGPRSRVCPFPMEVGGLLSEGSPLLEFEARQLARYLTVADARAFRSVTLWDFVGKLKAGGAVVEETGRMGRIDAFARRSDMIRNWIALELTTLSPRKPRRKLLEKLILTAHYARAHGNFHTPLFILLALTSPPVRRLKRTWDAVPAPVMEKLRTLERLLDLGENMKELRRQVKAVEAGGGGFVMFLPVFMKDATFVVEGNKEFVERTEVVRGFGNEGMADDAVGESDDVGSHLDDKNDPTITDLVPRASPPAPLVNFDKYRKLTGDLRRHMDAAARYAWGIHLHLPLPNGVPASTVVPSAAAPNASTLVLAVDPANPDYSNVGMHPVTVQLPPQADEMFERDLKEVVERRLAWCADEALGGREGAWMRVAMDCAARCAGEDES